MKNKVQFHKDSSLSEFMKHYGTEKQCRKALFEWRWPQGYVCPEGISVLDDCPLFSTTSIGSGTPATPKRSRTSMHSRSAIICAADNSSVAVGKLCLKPNVLHSA